MGSRTQPAASDRVYEDFEPLYEWVRDERQVNVMLPGFRRDQLKVQVTSKPTLRLIGERMIAENRWRRFTLELPIQSDYDTDNVTAKFEGGTLSIKFGKLSFNTPKESTAPTQKVEQQKQDTPNEETKTNGEVSADQKTPQKEETKTNGSSETKEETPAPKTRPVSRTKTRLIDFALGSGNQVDNEVIGDSHAGNNKFKKIVKWMVVVYAVVALVALGLYAKNAFISSNGESETESFFQEL
ncbi:unnamed protein product [Sphenostylis stenocarpa]|uniref:SHSP domain-containing protein n=1 Tax=Sphenostylis stenocarpa TaxID=92480 RepID=A0AA86T3Y6_9FABA|nr:unnamed protein product [Sphenostylis stenocarpa]